MTPLKKRWGVFTKSTDSRAFYFAVRALNGEREERMNTVIIETLVSLKTINAAVGELTNAAEQTVLELNQTVVHGLKEASADGKLTQEEIANLGKLLLDGALAKMSDSGIGVLKAANVDINAIVTGAGEALIARIKRGEVENI